MVLEILGIGIIALAAHQYRTHRQTKSTKLDDAPHEPLSPLQDKDTPLITEEEVSSKKLEQLCGPQRPRLSSFLAHDPYPTIIPKQDDDSRSLLIRSDTNNSIATYAESEAIEEEEELNASLSSLEYQALVSFDDSLKDDTKQEEEWDMDDQVMLTPRVEQAQRM